MCETISNSSSADCRLKWTIHAPTQACCLVKTVVLDVMTAMLLYHALHVVFVSDLFVWYGISFLVPPLASQLVGLTLPRPVSSDRIQPSSRRLFDPAVASRRHPSQHPLSHSHRLTHRVLLVSSTCDDHRDDAQPARTVQRQQQGRHRPPTQQHRPPHPPPASRSTAAAAVAHPRRPTQRRQQQ